MQFSSNFPEAKPDFFNLVICGRRCAKVEGLPNLTPRSLAAARPALTRSLAEGSQLSTALAQGRPGRCRLLFENALRGSRIWGCVAEMSRAGQDERITSIA